MWNRNTQLEEMQKEGKNRAKKYNNDVSIWSWLLFEIDEYPLILRREFKIFFSLFISKQINYPLRKKKTIDSYGVLLFIGKIGKYEELINSRILN